jgi:hypothetical protein
MNPNNCIFCKKPLNDSDEHIIPECLNGKLHSRTLICKDCNNKYGVSIDASVKKLFNPILLLLGFDNANSVQSKDPDGNKYLYDKKGKVSRIVPELSEIKKDGKTYISVEGDKKSAIKFFEKQTAEKLKQGYKLLKSEVKEISDSTPPLAIEANLEITPELILELNKIAIEFYAMAGFDLNEIKENVEKVQTLDKTLNNVIFCNWLGEIRELNSNEISHLLVLRTNKNGTLYCYIELFNIVCAYIKLKENCKDFINIVYHQDAITGERFTKDIELKLDTEPINNNSTEDFSVQTNEMLYRFKEREFIALYNEIFIDQIKKAKEEVGNGTLENSELAETCAKRCCEAVAYLTVYEYPYMVEDFKDEENQEINYIHSNLQEGQFEKFCDLNKTLIGVKVIFKDESIFILDSFIKTPFIKRNGITLVKVFCVLTNVDTKRKKYIPYREFFEGIIPNDKK